MAAINMRPQVRHGALGLTYVENDAPVVVCDSVVITDGDSAFLVGATVQLTRGYQSGSDLLGFVNTNGISGSWDALTGTLTLTGTASLAVYEAALRSITYVNTSEDPQAGIRTAVFQVDDGSGVNNLSRTMPVRFAVKAVNDLPVLTVDPVLAYTSFQAPALLDASLTLTDVDSAVRSATVTISGNYHPGEDVLSWTDSANVHGTFRGGVLTLTGIASAAEYEQVLRSITYTDTLASPSLATRTITIQVEDSDHSGPNDFSNVGTIAVMFAAPPDVGTSGTPVAYTEGDPAVTLEAALTLVDIDDPDMAGATVSITAGFDAGDSLLFTNTANITGSYNSATGVLTLTGTASVAEYQAALRTIQFVGTTDDPSASKTVTWVVSDGTDNSTPVTTTISVTPVNDAPVLSIGATLAYTENDAATAIAPSASLSDVDSADFNGGSLTVAFTANGTSADQLTIINQGTGAGQIGVSGSSITYGGTAIGTFTGGVNGGNLVITFTSTAATQAAVQALLRDIAFSNTSESPSTLARTVGFTVVDGDGGTDSASASATVNVASVNDLPVVTPGSSPASYTEGGSNVIVDAALTVGEADNANLAGAAVSITGNFQAGDALLFTNTAQITGSYNTGTGVLTLSGTATVAQYQAALRSIAFQSSNDDPAATRTVSWVVSDGTNNSSTQTSTINITAVNDAPTLSVSATLAYTENDAATAIATGATLADPDSTDFNGGSLTASFTANGTSADQLTILNQGTGAGQIGVSGSDITYGGVTIGTFSGGTNGSNLVITFTSAAATQAAVQALVRDIAFSNSSDNPSTLARTVGFTLVDGDGTANSGADTGTASATVNVTAVNDAPTVTPSGTAASFTENGGDVAVNPAIVLGDVDDTNLEGATVEITGNFQLDDTLLFFNTPEITGVYNVGTGVLELTGTATVAQYQAALRSITFTSTTNDPTATKTISWTVNDGTDNSSTQTSTINITAVNDAPALSVSATLAYTENDAATAIATGATLADPDSTDFNGGSLTASFTANGTSADQLTILNQGTGAGQIGVSGSDITYGGVTIGTFSGGTNGSNLVITFTSAAATQAAVQALVRDIAFSNSSDNPSTLARTVGFTLVDGDGTANSGADTGTASAIVNVTAVNDAPTIDTTGGSAAFTEGGLAVTINGAITLSDPDDTSLESATVSITSGFQAGDVLAFTNTAQITGSYNSGTGVLTLTGTATLAQYEAALRSITFDSPSNSPGASRTITFVASDGTDSSSSATSSILITEVNSAPTVTTTGGSAAFVEDAGAVAIDSAIAVNDGDTTTLVGATVHISTGFQSGQDVLAFTPTGSITGSYNATTGTLTLSGSGTLAEYQTALASVTYNNTSDAPDTSTRTIEFQVDDGQSVDNLSTVATRTVTVTAANDPPSLSLGAALSYTENDAASAIVPNATVSDADSSDFNGGSLTVSFTANGTSADQLAVLNVGTGAGEIGVSGGNVTYGGTAIASYTGGTNGTNLVISFNSAAATPAAVQALVRAITFSNTSENPSTAARTVHFALVDGDGGSDTAAADATVGVTAVNDAPALANGAGTTLAYTENDAATLINSGLTISDVDSTNLTGATVTISTNYQNGQDVLSATTAGTSITASFSAATGVLTLSGTDTVAHYQTVIDSVKYQNTSEDPSSLTRTVSFQVDDGSATDHASNTVTRDISVTPVNDAPAITAGGTLAYTENDAATAVKSTLTLSDAEGDSITGATVSISANFQSGQDVLSFTPTGSITGSFNASTGVLTLSGTDTAANYQAALQSVTYANTSDNPSTAARTISFQATDSHGDTGTAATTTVTVAAVNDAPVNTVPADSSVGTAFSNTAMSISGVSIADVDAGSGTMTVHVTAASGGLTFSLAGGASVSAGTNGTGDVTLSGNATQLNAALATLSYKSNDGFTGSDTITVVTSDGGNSGSGGAKTDTDTFHVGVVPQVFIIDNTNATADTSSSGTAANPFNSIANFNSLAADGTGDYIYVMHGTGTYSESSGFTLLNNQQVYGQGQTLQFTNPVTGQVVTVGTGSGVNTPVISVTGASQAGVTLAQGNTLKGFDIATTLGSQTGVTDGNGTVGTLNINDVSVTGTGKAVDIDQGGALNVTFDTLSSSGSTQQGVQLAGALTGTFTGTTGAISGSTGTGFLVGDGSGTANTGGTFTLTYGGSISTTGTATAVDIEDRSAGAGTVTLSGAISHSSGNGAGVVIDDIAAGAITLSGNNTLDTGTAAAILVTDVTGGGLTFSGTQDIDTTSGNGITLQNNTVAASFTGSFITVNTSTGNGIAYISNSGSASFNNTGTGLDVVTNGGWGILGSSSGTLTIQGTSNSVDSTSAAAVNLTNTTIGASGLNFESISSTGGSSGISLSNTGSTGSLTVTGGTAHNGGTISSATGDGIFVDSGTINLNYVTIQNAAAAGISATNLLGSNSFNNSTITGFGTGSVNVQDGIHWVNTGSNAGSLTVNSSSFTNAAKGNDGLWMEAQGSGAMTLTVSSSTFSGLFGDGIQVNGATGATSIERVTIQNSTFSNAVNSNPSYGNGGISLNPLGDVTFYADVNGNTLTNLISNPGLGTLGVIGITNGQTADGDITIRNNTISASGGRGITATIDGGTGDLLIDNNSIDDMENIGSTGISVNYTNSVPNSTVGSGNLTISNNDLGQSGSTSGNLWSTGTGNTNAILVTAQNGGSAKVAITGNIISANTINDVVRLNTGTGTSGGGLINGTVSGNTITDTDATTHSEFKATAGTSSLTGTVNLNIFSNVLPGSGVGVISLVENASGTLNVTQASSAAVSSNNSSATVNVTGSPTYGASTPPTPSSPSLPLLIEGGSAAGDGSAHAITISDLTSAVAAAANRWAQLPLTHDQLDTLSNLTFALGDLSGGAVGGEAPGLIVIDADAGGHGWFVDATPMDDAEFTSSGSPTLMYGTGAAATQVDLLTVLMHEIGHALGLSDLYGAQDQADIMYGYIAAGERRVPSLHDVSVTLVGVYEGGA